MSRLEIVRSVDVVGSKLRLGGKIAIVAGVIASSIFTSGFAISRPAYEVLVDSVVVATVATEEVAHESIKTLLDAKNESNNAINVIDNEVEIRRFYINGDVSTEEELNESLAENLDYLVSGYELVVDGNSFGYFKSEKDAQYVLDTIKSKFLNSMSVGEVKAFVFEEKIEINPVAIEEEKISEPTEVLKKLFRENTGTYTVEEHDDIDMIVEKTANTIEELQELNSEIDMEGLTVGTEMEVYRPLLTPLLLEEISYLEPIEYMTEEVLDENMYEGDTKTLTEGKVGVQKIIASAVKKDGEKVKNEIVSTVIVEESVNEVLAVGTKERPKTAATNTFIKPVSGQFSSGYGKRFGRMHYGIDIRAPKGTPIHSTDGGVVITASSHPTYGNYIEVDHKNGFMTRYAHLSSFSVSVGTEVFQGQQIGGVGNTGRSTGNHLHFEVLLNGVNQNPSNYVFY